MRLRLKPYVSDETCYIKCDFLVLQYSVVVFCFLKLLDICNKILTLQPATQAEQDFILNKPTFFLILFLQKSRLCFC